MNINRLELAFSSCIALSLKCCSLSLLFRFSLQPLNLHQYAPKNPDLYRTKYNPDGISCFKSPIQGKCHPADLYDSDAKKCIRTCKSDLVYLPETQVCGLNCGEGKQYDVARSKCVIICPVGHKLRGGLPTDETLEQCFPICPPSLNLIYNEATKECDYSTDCASNVRTSFGVCCPSGRTNYDRNFCCAANEWPDSVTGECKLK